MTKTYCNKCGKELKNFKECRKVNLREWRHFFKLRAANMTGKAHPQMLEVTIPLLNELKSKIPVVFDDIKA